MSNKSIRALAGVAAAALIALSGVPSLTRAQDPIKVGGGFALTGAESALDLPAANGAQLAAKEINAAGGVLGRPLELVVRDSKYEMDVTATIAKQFVEEDKVVAVVGFTDSDSVLASGPIIQKAGIPFITAGATSPKLPDQIGDLLWLACFGDNVQAAAGAEYGYKTFGTSAYLLIDKGVEYTSLLGAYFKARFTELGGTLVLEDTYEDSATDFSAQITKLKALEKQPDFYYIAAMPYNVGPVVKQLREAGLNGPVIGGDGYDTPDLVSVAGAASENVYFTTHALMDKELGTDGIKKFIDAYNKEYTHDPENAFAALGYDAVYLLADAITRAGSTDAAAIQKALNETKDYKAITGSITFAGSRVPQKGVTMILVKDGKFTLAAEIVPEKVPSADTK
ncbi:MAG: ABC transporter substrate-binding protein [Anaerolineae bacterium]|nr:ABC transporter substrate-binding protein [Anaerolineae bacterium]